MIKFEHIVLYAQNELKIVHVLITCLNSDKIWTRGDYVYITIENRSKYSEYPVEA